MIVAMKKVYILTQKKDVRSVLEKLRALSVLHVVPVGNLKEDRSALIRERISSLEKVLFLLGQYKPLLPVEPRASDADVVIKNVFDLFAEIDQIQRKMDARASVITRWLPWGDFNPDEVRSLRSKGLFVYFFEGLDQALDGLSKDVIIEIIVRHGLRVRAVLVARNIRRRRITC